MKVNDFPKVTVILRGYTYDQIHTVVKNLIGTRLELWKRFGKSVRNLEIPFW